jgi:hypothetical protein
LQKLSPQPLELKALLESETTMKSTVARKTGTGMIVAASCSRRNEAQIHPVPG